MQLAPHQDDVMTALRSVLLAMLPAGTEVVRGQANRVPEIKSADFVVMTPVRRERLETNTDVLDDTRIVGSVAGAVLTVESVSFGTIAPGRTLTGQGVTAGSVIRSPGNASTWNLNIASTVPSGTVLGCGAMAVESPYQLAVQLDFHGAGGSGQPADNAQTVATLLRDDWAVRQFAAINPSIVPLYATDPRQMPFINGENQFEDRWIVEAELQANVAVSVPQDYADSAAVGLINVDTEYPA